MQYREWLNSVVRLGPVIRVIPLNGTAVAGGVIALNGTPAVVRFRRTGRRLLRVPVTCLRRSRHAITAAGTANAAPAVRTCPAATVTTAIVLNRAWTGSWPGGRREI